MKRNIIGLLALVALLPFSRSFAQEGEIIYTEFDPPLFIDGDHQGNGNFGSILVDVDQDGTCDYKIYIEFGKSSFYFVQEGHSNTQFRDVELFEEDTIIPYYGPWTGIPATSSWTNWSPLEPINDETGEYYEKVGICKVINGERFFGWIHRYGHIDSNFPFMMWMAVDRMAFCTIPDYPLRWGQTEVLGVEDRPEATAFATIHPNPACNSFTLTGAQLSEARLYSVTGQLVATKQGEGTESLTVDISDLPSGLYFVTAIGKDGRKCVQKVVKQ